MATMPDDPAATEESRESAPLQGQDRGPHAAPLQGFELQVQKVVTWLLAPVMKHSIVKRIDRLIVVDLRGEMKLAFGIFVRFAVFVGLSAMSGSIVLPPMLLLLPILALLLSKVDRNWTGTCFVFLWATYWFFLAISLGIPWLYGLLRNEPCPDNKMWRVVCDAHEDRVSPIEVYQPIILSGILGKIMAMEIVSRLVRERVVREKQHVIKAGLHAHSEAHKNDRDDVRDEKDKLEQLGDVLKKLQGIRFMLHRQPSVVFETDPNEAVNKPTLAILGFRCSWLIVVAAAVHALIPAVWMACNHEEYRRHLLRSFWVSDSSEAILTCTIYGNILLSWSVVQLFLAVMDHAVVEFQKCAMQVAVTLYICAADGKSKGLLLKRSEEYLLGLTVDERRIDISKEQEWTEVEQEFQSMMAEYSKAFRMIVLGHAGSNEVRRVPGLNCEKLNMFRAWLRVDIIDERVQLETVISFTLMMLMVLIVFLIGSQIIVVDQTLTVTTLIVAWDCLVLSVLLVRALNVAVDMNYLLLESSIQVLLDWKDLSFRKFGGGGARRQDSAESVGSGSRAEPDSVFDASQAAELSGYREWIDHLVERIEKFEVPVRFMNMTVNRETRSKLIVIVLSSMLSFAWTLLRPQLHGLQKMETMMEERVSS